MSIKKIIEGQPGWIDDINDNFASKTATVTKVSATVTSTTDNGNNYCVAYKVDFNGFLAIFLHMNARVKKGVAAGSTIFQFPAGFMNGFDATGINVGTMWLDIDPAKALIKIHDAGNDQWLYTQAVITQG